MQNASFLDLDIQFPSPNPFPFTPPSTPVASEQKQTYAQVTGGPRPLIKYQKPEDQTVEDPIPYFHIPYQYQKTSLRRTIPTMAEEISLTIRYRTRRFSLVKHHQLLSRDIPPLIIDPFPDPNLRISPFPERHYLSTLFRLRVIPWMVTSVFKGTLPIRIGRTIEFLGHENPYALHVVQWLQWIDQHETYIKVRGIYRDGTPIPFNDPYFPSFLLVVPSCIADLPIPADLMDLINLRTHQLREQYERGGKG